MPVESPGVSVAPEIERALGDLLRQYTALIRRVVCKAAAGRSSEPEEIEQRVLEALWSAAREQTIRHPASYVYQIAVRETVRALRRQQQQPWAVTQEVAERVAAPAADPEEEAAATELGRAVERALQGLSRDRATAARAHLAGFAVEEIMEAQGWSYQKARNLIARGVADLRAALRAEGIDGD